MILIEVSEVIRLKKGLSNIIKKIKQEIKKKIIKSENLNSYDFKIATSLNPYVSELICLNSKRNTSTKVLEENKMLKKIQSLPVKMICESNETVASLERLGVKNIGQLIRLPKKGLRHRFEGVLIEKINQITSSDEVGLKKIITPVNVNKKKEFLDPILDKKILLYEIEKLLKKLCLKLNEYYLETNQINITIFSDSRKNPSFNIIINLSGATNDPNKLYLLTKEKIDRSELFESVREIRLHSPKVSKVYEENKELFFIKKNSLNNISNFIDIIVTRVQRTSVVFFNNRSNYVPEQKFIRLPFTGNNNLTNNLQTDERETEPGVIWLYENPILLEKKYGKPYYRGSLVIHESLERIETNWWTDKPVKRDYYIADTVNHERIWIYLTPERDWYLHGKFW